MRVYVYDSGRVDFEAPIWMTDEQREEFIQFFKKTVRDVEVKDVEEAKGVFGSEDAEYREWTVDDYYELLSSDPNAVVARKLRRTEMSIVMKRGEFVPEFYVWLKAKGYTLPASKKMVGEYLKED